MNLTASLHQPGPLGLLWWQWLALPALVLAALVLGALFGFLTRRVLARLAAHTRTEWDDMIIVRIGGPLTALWAIGLFSAGQGWLDLGRGVEATLTKGLHAAAYLVLFWAGFRLVDVAFALLGGGPWARGNVGLVGLLPLGRKVSKVVLLAIGAVAVLNELGFQVASLLAGLGIGGIALALAAQKTVENLFGSLAIGEMNNVPLKRDPRAAQWLAEGIDISKAMGLPIVMPACFGNGDLDMSKTQEIDHLVGVLKDVIPKAEKHGILIGLESYLSAKDTLKILDRVGSPNMTMYYDVGNSTDKGYDIYREIPLMGKRICEFHFKDANFRLGRGRIDFRKVRSALDKINYRGWIHLESAVLRDAAEEYAADYRYLRGIFPERPEP